MFPSSGDEQQVSVWIFRCIILFALSLIVVGGVLFGLVDDGDETAAHILNEDTALPPGTNAWQADVGANAGYLPVATPIPWLDFLPVGNELIETTLRHVGQTAIGPDDAQVTVIEFGAYGCTGCRRMYQKGIMDNILSRFADNMRFVFVDWPVIHTNDLIAAEAVLCALDQGTEVYWELHRELFDLSDEQFNLYTDYQRFTTLAEGISDLDTEKFAECMVDNRHQAFIQDMVQVGFDLNLSGTPTFFVNGEMTYEYELVSKIETALFYSRR